MDVCDECKVVEICSCENFCIAPDGGITAGEDYVLTLVDKFGTKYTQDITANVYGTLCVDITAFEDGFFNPYAGTLIVSIALASAPSTPLQLIYGSLEYECISLVVKKCPNSSSDVVIPPDEDCVCFTVFEKVKISAADTAAGTYTNALLVGLAEATDFMLWTDEGSGTVVDLTDGFNVFTSGTGTLTIPQGKYVLLIFKQ